MCFGVCVCVSGRFAQECMGLEAQNAAQWRRRQQKKGSTPKVVAAGPAPHSRNPPPHPTTIQQHTHPIIDSVLVEPAAIVNVAWYCVDEDQLPAPMTASMSAPFQTIQQSLSQTTCTDTVTADAPPFMLPAGGLKAV